MEENIEQEQYDSSKKWYLIRSINGHDKRLKESIKLKAKLEKVEHLLYDVVSPSLKTQVMKNGKKKVVEKALFPGYLMVCADVTHGTVKEILQSASGSLGYVGGIDNKTPKAMREIEVKRMLGINHLKPANMFTVGEIVKMLNGPFSTFSGNIQSIDNEKKTLKVMIKIFGRETPVETDFTGVEKINQ